MTIQSSRKSYNQGFTGFILTKKQILFLIQVLHFLPWRLGPKNDPSDVHLHGQNNFLSDSTSEEKPHTQCLFDFIWCILQKKLIIRMFCDKGNYYLHFRLLRFQQCQNWCSRGGSDQNSSLIDSIHCLILKKRKQHFGKSICSCLQMNGWHNTYSAMSEKKSYSQPLNRHWEELQLSGPIRKCSPTFHLGVGTDLVPKKVYFFLKYEKMDKFKILVILKVIYCNWEPSRNDG